MYLLNMYIIIYGKIQISFVLILFIYVEYLYVFNKRHRFYTHSYVFVVSLP